MGGKSGTVPPCMNRYGQETCHYFRFRVEASCCVHLARVEDPISPRTAHCNFVVWEFESYAADQKNHFYSAKRNPVRRVEGAPGCSAIRSVRGPERGGIRSWRHAASAGLSTHACVHLARSHSGTRGARHSGGQV